MQCPSLCWLDVRAATVPFTEVQQENRSREEDDDRRFGEGAEPLHLLHLSLVGGLLPLAAHSAPDQLHQEGSEAVRFDFEAWHASPHCLEVHPCRPLGLDELAEVACDGPWQVVILGRE